MPQRLSTLVRNTPRKIVDVARKVKVAHFTERDVKRVTVDGRDVWEVAFQTSGTGESHRCVVRFIGPTIKQDALVWVSCDCEDFRYRLEYALTEKKSSDLLHAQAEPPRKTNPRMQTRLCKHLLKITGIIPQAQSFMRPQAAG